MIIFYYKNIILGEITHEKNIFYDNHEFMINCRGCIYIADESSPKSTLGQYCMVITYYSGWSYPDLAILDYIDNC